MQPYHFVPGSAQLAEQANGEWVAEFTATVYTGQSFRETGNSLDASGTRVIEFEAEGPENSPLVNEGGSSAPYTRGSESQVELVLTKGGKRKNTIHTGYP